MDFSCLKRQHQREESERANTSNCIQMKNIHNFEYNLNSFFLFLFSVRFSFLASIFFLFHFVFCYFSRCRYLSHYMPSTFYAVATAHTHTDQILYYRGFCGFFPSFFFCRVTLTLIQAYVRYGRESKNSWYRNFASVAYIRVCVQA